MSRYAQPVLFICATSELIYILSQRMDALKIQSEQQTKGTRPVPLLTHF